MPGIARFSWPVSGNAEWQPEDSLTLMVQGRNHCVQRTGAWGRTVDQVCERHTEEAHRGRQGPREIPGSIHSCQEHPARTTPEGLHSTLETGLEMPLAGSTGAGASRLG